MEYTIHGFSQRKLVELGLDANDALILRWFIDFWHSGKMSQIVQEEETFLGVKYQAIIDDLPIMGITNRQALAKRFKKMCNCGLMKGCLGVNQSGTFTGFKVVDSVYVTLISDIQPK